MSKTILIISSSPRHGGNSDTLAEIFAKGAAESGNYVEKISLADKQIGFCTGCWGCLKTHKCVIHDDADSIVQKMRLVDVLVFATPIYYYEMSGQMKTLLDRANALYHSNYYFREVYLLTAAEATGTHTPDNAINGLKGWISCFGKAKFAGAVFAGGTTGVGTIKGHAALEEAYQIGKMCN